MSLFEYRIRTLIKYKSLIWELVRRDLRLKYRRSFFGYAWSILNPLLIMAVLTTVFSLMFKKQIDNYPVYLLTGRMLHEFLKNSTTSGMKSIPKNAALLKKVYVPKYIFTLAQITSCMVDFVLSLGALFIVMLVTRAPFPPTMLLMPFVIIQIYIFCCGLGFFLAQLCVFFKDIQYIYQAVMTALFYLTPIVYPITKLKKRPRIVFVITHLNPLYYYVEQFRAIVYRGELPSLYYVVGGCLLAIVMLVIGVYFFQKYKDRFILYI